MTQEMATGTVHAALESGVNFFDTAEACECHTPFRGQASLKELLHRWR